MKENQKINIVDHKIIGKQLDYYFTDNAVGGSIPFINEKGAVVLQILRRFVEDEEVKRGLILVQSPLVSGTSFLEISGHLSHYKDLIFETKNVNGSEIALRPVTCPFHFSYYKRSKHSYIELPIGYFETTNLFRKCKTGEQNGLYRTQHFTIGDSHIICRKDQVSNELISSLEYIKNILYALGLENDVFFVLSSGISKKGDYLGSDEEWTIARQYLSESLLTKNINYLENGNSAAFYGPKIDVFFKSYNKDVALFTIQLDFQLAKQFGMTYINRTNKEEYPIIIHRSSMSSYERMLGVLLEKYKGDLPFWLAPLQIKVFIIDEECIEYGNEIKRCMIANGFRIKLEKVPSKALSAKIREEIKQKTHFIAVIGKSEMEEKILSVRYYRCNQVEKMKLEDFINKLKVQRNYCMKVDTL